MEPYLCRFFRIEELVPKEIYDQFKSAGREQSLWWLFDYNALRMIDSIRGFYGVPATINNWHVGGDWHYRGFRPHDCKVGAKYSQHKFGRAFDMNLKGIPADQIRADMRSKTGSPTFMEVSACEDGVPWLHVDTRNKEPNSGIFFFSP